MNINLSFLLTALAILINFSLVQTRVEIFSPEVKIESEVENHSHSPSVLPVSIALHSKLSLNIVIHQASYLLISPEYEFIDVEKFFTVFPSDLPPPLFV